MKTIPLTQGKFALVDDEDFERLSIFKWHACRYSKTGTFYAVCVQYSKITVGGDGRRKHLRMHRLVLNASSGMVVDHIDGNGLNNLKLNLREATQSQNGMNRGKNSRNTTGYKGVHYYPQRNKYAANIVLNGVKKCLGYFATPQEAHEAYKKAAIELHGEFAKW